MLQPKRQKYRKQQKGRNRGIAIKGSTLAFGSYGLKSMDLGRITNRQLEAARIAMTRETKREGTVWIRIFPDKPVSSRPAGKRMGSGKGDIDRYVAVVKPGKIMYEVAGAAKEYVEDAFRKAGSKLPVKTKLVSKE